VTTPSPSAAKSKRGALSPSHPYSVKGERVREDLLELVRRRPSRVLSVGCGTAATEQLLEEQGAEVIGLDVSVDAVAIASTRITKAMVADVEVDELPELLANSFDLILCGDVLEHLRFTEHVLARLRGWIAPDGKLVVSVPNATHFSVLRELLLRRNWRYEDGGMFDRGHYRLFTRRSLVRLLDEHGFVVDEVTSIRRLPRRARLVRWVVRPALAVVPGLNEYVVQNWTVSASVKRRQPA
jgi:O-antigen biosynthesis protein